MARHIVVTGANRGLGLEFTRQYLQMGDRLTACCRHPESAGKLLELKQQFTDAIEIIPLDVNNHTQLKNLQKSLSQNRIDILINNAGIYGRRLEFGEVEADEWLDVLKTNTIAPMIITQSLVDSIAEDGKVILITSKMGSIDDNTSGGSYIYRSSKAALNAVGKSLSHDLIHRGIAVALCHPGWVATDMGGPHGLLDAETSVRGMLETIEKLGLGQSGHFFNYDGSEIPW